MNEYFLATLVRVDETVALQPAKPLDTACFAQHFPLPPQGFFIDQEYKAGGRPDKAPLPVLEMVLYPQLKTNTLASL
jgi:hypothetical protein